ncbi:MAG TPA: hypothetical protein VMT88_12355 [Actinomycetes bacterium]|nr:hypothetical protein [Actinomycetes bacterium]
MKYLPVRSFLTLGAVAGVSMTLLAIPAQAVTCSLTPTVSATASVESAQVDWDVVASNCVDVPTVEFEVKDQAAPSDDTGTVFSGLGLSGSQLVSGLAGGHTYDVTLTAAADTLTQQDATTVVPLMPSATTVTLNASAEEVTFGSSIDLKGIAKTAASAAAPGRTVSIERKAAGATDWSALPDTTTNGNGRYLVNVEPKKNTKYRATVDGVTSAVVAVQVDHNVKAAFRQANVKSGKRVVLKGHVGPTDSRVEVKLQKAADGDWKLMDSARLKDGTVKFSFKVHGDGRYRLLAPATDELGAGSDIAKVNVKGRK